MKQPIEAAQELLELAQENRQLTAHRFFLSYAFSRFRRTGIYSVWKNGISYFRKLRTVTLILKAATLILTVLQTGALVILSTVLFLILVPLLVAFMLGVLLTAFLESRRSNRYLKATLAGRSICVAFLSKKENPFLLKNVTDLTQNGNRAVILLSPYWISGRGLWNDHFYCTFREEHSHVYLVRRYYFFSLKKHVLHDTATYLY